MKEGLPLPCRIIVNPDRSYELIIHKPLSKFLLMQAAGIQKGAMEAGMNFIFCVIYLSLIWHTSLK
jgi:large subunit ribosomal protein L11